MDLDYEMYKLHLRLGRRVHTLPYSLKLGNVIKEDEGGIRSDQWFSLQKTE
jgi:hypothetical protein